MGSDGLAPTSGSQDTARFSDTQQAQETLSYILSSQGVREMYSKAVGPQAAAMAHGPQLPGGAARARPSQLSQAPVAEVPMLPHGEELTPNWTHSLAGAWSADASRNGSRRPGCHAPLGASSSSCSGATSNARANKYACLDTDGDEVPAAQEY